MTMSSGDERGDPRVARSVSSDEIARGSSSEEKDPFYGCYAMDAVFLASALDVGSRAAHSLMAAAQRVIRSLHR